MTAPTTHKATLELGPPVVDGEVRWLSATAMTRADPTQEGGCARAWHFKYVEDLDDPSTSSLALGHATHGVVENYLRTRRWAPGDSPLAPQAMRIAMGGARFMTPHLGDKLLIEQSMLTPRETAAIRAGSPGPGHLDTTLSAHGVPIAGHIDVLRRSPWYVTPMGERREEENPNTVEVLDWKTTKSFGWVKSGPALLSTVQMVTYGEFAARASRADHVRLSHVYLKSVGSADAQKSTTAVPREEIARRWERIDTLVGSIVEVARVPRGQSNEVEGNMRSCRAFNRPCPYADRCDMDKNRSLSDLLGVHPMSESLLDMFDEPKIDPASAVVLAMEAELAKLAAEEQAAAPATPAPPRVVVSIVPEAFAEAVRVLEASTWGFPQLGGAAAQFKAQMMGMGLTTGAALAGSGKLAKIPQVTDPALLVQLARDVKARDAAEAPAPAPVIATGLLSPETPASQPALAADPVPAAADAQLAAMLGQPQVTQSAPVSIVDGTPIDRSVASATITTTPAPAPEPAKPRRGRPPGSPTRKRAAPADTTAPEGAAVELDGFELYIDALPLSGSFEYLDAYCDELTDRLCKKYGVIDVRCAESGDLSFGKWVGVVAAFARAVPPEPGVYVVFTDNSVKKEIAAALAPLARGGSRGVR